MKNYIIDCKFTFYVKFKNLELFIAEMSKYFEILNIKETALIHIPKHIRIIDDKLKTVPLYEIEIKGKEYLILLAEEAIIVSIKNSKYTSWEKSFKPFLEDVSIILNFSSILEFNKISLQYIDFFEFNIFEKGKVQCKNIDAQHKIFLKSSYSEDNVIISKILTNKGRFKEKIGSIVDITTTTECKKEKFLTLIDTLHDKNINEFKRLIPDEIVRELGL